MVTAENRVYLQILEVLDLLENAPVDAEKPHSIIAKYIRNTHLQYQKLIVFFLYLPRKWFYSFLPDTPQTRMKWGFSYIQHFLLYSFPQDIFASWAGKGRDFGRFVYQLVKKKPVFMRVCGTSVAMERWEK